MSRILQSYESLKSFLSSNESVGECLAKLVDHFAGFESALTSFTKSSDDAFSEQLAETIHNATGLSSPYVDSHLSKTWSLVSAELNAFRPPFESVNSEVPELISPTAAVVATSLYYYGRFFEKANEYYIHTKEEPGQRFKVLRMRLCEHLRYAISLYDFVKTSQGQFCGSALDVKELEFSLWPSSRVTLFSTAVEVRYSSTKTKKQSKEIVLALGWLFNRCHGGYAAVRSKHKQQSFSKAFFRAS